MGYYMTQMDTDFKISANKFPALIQSVKSLPRQSTYAWVNMEYANANNIEDIFNYWRWEVTLDESGDIVDIYFSGEKMGDDEIFFKAIAPFVEPDSFIQMRGEGDDMWRWFFDGKNCIEKYATITWD